MNEREKAKKLRKSRDWQNSIANASCYYCSTKLDAATATMDHIVPVSRGGRSTPGNTVACCKSCNTAKGDLTAAEFLLKRL